MTNTTTRDLEQTTLQTLQCIEAGAQLVRITTPTLDDVDALETIKSKVLQQYPNAVLCADIHFSPKVAVKAAAIADKIRINPGNFVNSSKFDNLQQELKQIEHNLIELIEICRINKTAIRIGTNHGSLSPRIVEKYGNTPQGLVEATLEYVRIFEKLGFDNIVLSLKSSNPTVMVQANRLIVDRMLKSEVIYPLHLGVTEAGNDTEGRIKSALGIGALLVDGIGDTIRVSLTESPYKEIPICQKIIKHIEKRKYQTFIPEIESLFINPFEFNRRQSYEILGIGNNKECKVVATIDQQDFVFQSLLPDFVIYQEKFLFRTKDYQTKRFENALSCVDAQTYVNTPHNQCAIYVNLNTLTNELIAKINNYKNALLIIRPITDNFIGEVRYILHKLHTNNCQPPIILYNEQNCQDTIDFEIATAIDTSVFLIDGQIDALVVKNKASNDINYAINTNFEILQAAHRRIFRTEYISCPSCGRTQFDIEQVTARIKQATQHLKGLKIAIMGCIVNGPGELADADYGYCGAGKNLVNLYKKHQLVKKNVDEKNAVNELIDLIKQNGDWLEQNQKN